MIRLGSLFRKRRAPDPDQWQPGDQAECITHGKWWHVDGEPSSGPRHGSLITVEQVRDLVHPLENEVCTFLQFTSFGSNVYPASCFRKVRPHADEATAAEPEFAALIRKQPAPAPRQPEEVG